jgi:hypothetical protein
MRDELQFPLRGRHGDYIVTSWMFYDFSATVKAQGFIENANSLE